MGGGLVGEELLRELADEEPAWPGFREPQSDAWRLVVLLSRACPLCLSESVEKEGIGGSALPLRGEFGRLWNGDGLYELTAKAAKGPSTACFLPGGRS